MTRSTAVSLLVLSVAVLALTCGPRAPSPGEYDARDVTGNYALTYDNVVTMRLDLGGVVRTATSTGYTGVASFGTWSGQPLDLDLGAFCARPEVRCPSEAFWSKVAINQPDLSRNGFPVQTLVVVNDTIHSLDAGQRAESLGGLIDHNQDDKYLLGLGVAGAASTNCLLFAVSLAGGRFTRIGETSQTVMMYRTPAGRPCTPSDAGVDAGTDAGVDGGADAGVSCTLKPVLQRTIPPDAGVAGIADGKVFLGYAGACAFGPVVAGATLTFETGYTGVRTGKYDPPPFTPAAVVLPDGGYEGGLEDAGLP